MELGLENKSIVVGGASSGLGRAVAEQLVAEGARVLLVARSEDAIQEVANRWSLNVGSPWSDEATCAWVAPAVRKDGLHVVLKLGMPHLEAAARARRR